VEMEHRLKVSNGNDRDLHVQFEWDGLEVVIPPGQSRELVTAGPPGTFEVATNGDTLVVFSWLSGVNRIE
jgi:hypothetical protein